MGHVWEGGQVGWSWETEPEPDSEAEWTTCASESRQCAVLSHAVKRSVTESTRRPTPFSGVEHSSSTGNMKPHTDQKKAQSAIQRKIHFRWIRTQSKFNALMSQHFKQVKMINYGIGESDSEGKRY